MKKAAIILGCYLVILMITSLVCSSLGVKEFKAQQNTLATLSHPMMLATIVAGLTALRLVVSSKAFFIFVLVYSLLWILRYPVNVIGVQVGEIDIWGRKLRVDWMTFRYYDSVTRITTPLPFIIFWFINHFVELLGKSFTANSPNQATDESNNGLDENSNSR